MVRKLLILFLTLLAVVAEDNLEAPKCQLSRPLKKQVAVRPLAGMCLQDAVVILSKTLRTIGNEELGVTSFQEKLDKLDFVNISSSLDTRLKNLADRLDAKLTSYSDLLKLSSNVIHQILVERSYSVYNDGRNKLDLLGDKSSDICTEIANALSSTMRDQDWKNLHILPLNHPETMCGPPSLAHNIGPLLLSQCSKSRNVILLMEHGISMSEGDVAAAQMAAKAIIDVLGDNDRVTVVGLAGHGYVHCSNGLIRATDINKYQINRHIDSVIRTDSNQTLEIDFIKLTQNVTGEIVLIHVTNILENVLVKMIATKIASTGLITHVRSVLILSNMHPYNHHNNIPKDDTVIILPTQNVLGYEIAKLFSHMNCSTAEHKEYYLSDPYFEPYSKSMIVSAGQITNSVVLSLDIKMKDFLEDITYFNAGPSTYAVLFDKNEVVWMHKNFPRMEVQADQLLKVYLRTIEDLDVHTVTAMIKQFEGVITIQTNAGKKKILRWKHLIYSELIVCLISEREDESLPVTKTAPPLPPNILHHRLDLMLHSAITSDNVCTSHNRIMTYATGVVYLSSWCFQSPNEQLKLLETGSAVTVQSYMAYIKDVSRLLANPGLHPSVKPDVAMVAQILNYFKSRHSDSPLNKFIVRRYVVASVSGSMEVYPGIVLDSGLDPKRRAWYRRAFEHPGKIVFTTPYLDAGGAGYVVTMSHTVYEGRSAALHSNNDPVLAVLSMDITLGYFSRLLRNMFPFCNESTVKCFLMDDKGYLIFHPSMLKPNGKIDQQHLTHKELLVANDILNHDLFVKKKVCANYLDGTIQRYYQFNTSLEDVLTNIVHGEHCVKYQVAAVPNTNAFLGVVNVTCDVLRAFCPCSTMDRLCLNCKRMEQTECECPCECSLYTSSCSDTPIERLEPCPPADEQGSSLQTPWAPPDNVKSCPTFDCKSYQSEDECLGVVGCQWCSIDSDGETTMDRPFCSDVYSCFKGVYGNIVPYGDGTYNSQSTDDNMGRDWPSVGPVAGGILTFVLILGVTLFCYRLRTAYSGVEHQCLHLPTAPDTLRMTHLDGDAEAMELDQAKGNLDSLLHDGIAPISPYRVSSNYRRPPGGDSDHGYSTMTPHDDSEQQTFAEPLLVMGSNLESDLSQQNGAPPPTTHLGSPHHVLAPVTVHRHMETNYC